MSKDWGDGIRIRIPLDRTTVNLWEKVEASLPKFSKVMDPWDRSTYGWEGKELVSVNLLGEKTIGVESLC